MTFLPKTNVNPSEMEQFQLLQWGVSILIGAPTYGVLERMQLKTENNKTFLVNVKWAGRVNVLLYPKGPHNKKTGPLWEFLDTFCFIIERHGHLNWNPSTLNAVFLTFVIEFVNSLWNLGWKQTLNTCACSLWTGKKTLKLNNRIIYWPE